MKKLLLIFTLLLTGMSIMAAETTVTFDFSNNGYGAPTKQGRGTATDGIITLAGSSFAYYTGGLRIYNGCTLDISGPANSTIKSVEFTLQDSSSNTGPLSLATGAEGTYANLKWTGSASVVKLKNASGKQFRTSKVVVVYEGEGGGDTNTVSKPTITPDGGAVEEGAIITFGCATDGVTYHYSWNGGIEATGVSTTAQAGTLSVYATKDGMTQSSTATANFTIVGNLTTYYKITSIDDVVDGDYVIASHNNSNSYYMDVAVQNSKYASTKTDGVFNNDKSTLKVSSDYAFTITKLANGNYTLHSSKGYLKSTGKTSLSYSDTASGAEWKISFTTSGVIKVSPVLTTTYYLICNPSASRFSIYDGPTTSMFDLTLYGPEVVIEKVDWNPTLADMALEIGESKTVALGSEHPSAITYSATPEGIVTVSANGVVKALKAGSATVNLAWSGEKKFNDGNVSFNVTVSKKTFALPQGDMTLTVGENEYISTGNEKPALSFSVQGDAVTVENAKVFAEKVGTAQVTATWAEDDTWNAGNASFGVTVNPKNFDIALADKTIDTESAYQIALPEEKPATVRFTSSNTGVATVSQTGLVEPKGVGSTTVTVAWDADDVFAAGEKSFTVTVRLPQQAGSIGFSRDAIKGIVGYPASWQAAHVVGDGNVTYSATPSGIVTLDSATGEITSVDAAGTVTITATLAGTEAYTGATSTYTLTVEENPAAVSAGTSATFDFSTKNAYGLYTWNSSTVGGGQNDLGNMEDDRTTGTPVTSITSGSVTLDLSGNYRLFEDYWNKDGSYHYELRVYEGYPSTLTFTSNGGRIKSITFSDAISTKNYANVEGEVSDDLKSTTYTYAEPVESDTYYLYNNADRIEVATITVEVESDGDKAQPELGFAENFTNITEGDIYEGMCGGVKGYDATKLVYTVDEGTNLTDYEIDGNGTEDFVAMFNTPGVYTVRASYPGSANMVAGQAVMRVNVFPKLTVNSEDAIEVGENYAVVPHGSEKEVAIAGTPLTVKLYKGSAKHDGKLSVADETHTVVMKYGDKDTFTSPEQDVHVVVRPARPEYNQAGELSVASGHTIYYMQVNLDASAASLMSVAPEFDPTGWTRYTTALQPSETDAIYRAVAVNDVHAVNVASKQIPGEELSFVIHSDGLITAIDEITTDSAKAPVRYFNLQGVELPAAPSAGVYLRVEGTKATKLLAR